MESLQPRSRRKSSINLRASLRRISVATSTSPASLDAIPLTPTTPSIHQQFDQMPTPTSTHFSNHNPPSLAANATITTGSSPDNLATTVSKRISTLKYLKEAHEGKVYWLNTILLKTSDLATTFEHTKMKTRTIRLAILGMSISSLLDITTAHDFLRGLLSLLQEFDSISDEKFDRKNQKGNSLFRGSSKGRKASGGTDLSTGIPESGDTSALFSPNIPFELDYFQVLFATCDVLIEAYQKILRFLNPPLSSPNPNSAMAGLGIPLSNFPMSSNGLMSSQRSKFTPALLDLTSKSDVRIKKIMLAITKDIDGVARNVIKEEISMFGGGED